MNPLVQGVATKAASLGVGTAVSSAIGTAAGSAGAAVFGAEAGSVVPIVGTVVGAAVGYLASMVLGRHANYAQIAHDVAAQMAIAETYKQIAGVYPGRVYGAKDMQEVWRGMLHEDFFNLNRSPQTCPVQQCIANPSFCIQRPGCGGNQSWVDDLFEGKAADPAARSLTGAAKTAISQGLTSIEAADQIFIPNWAPSHGSTGVWIPWAYPDNTQDPTLARQMIIDALDALMYQYDSSLPVWYGTIPSSPAPSASSASTSSSTGLVMPAGTPAIQAASNPVASPVAASLSTPPAIGATVTAIPEPSTGAMLTLPTGEAYTYAGTDAAGGWIVQDSSGNLWHLSGSSLVPLASAGAQQSAVSSLSEGSGYIPQSYAPAQQAAAAAPAGSTAAMTAGTGSSSISSLDLLLLAAAAGGAIILAKRHKS